MGTRGTDDPVAQRAFAQICVVALFLLAGCATVSLEKPADLVVTNARVITVDERFSLAEAFAVRDGRFVAVGGAMPRYPDGELNGELVNNARQLVKLPPPPALRRDDLIAMMRKLHRVGITSIRVPGNPNPAAEWALVDVALG